VKLLISAGETSGDRLGAALMGEIAHLRPEATFFGMGGSRMANRGLARIVDAGEVSVVGLFEVLEKLPAVLRAHRELGRAALRERPDAAILVDFPDFHFRLGRHLARSGIPVVYYVSPQVWAWRSGRVRVMKTFVRRVVTLFPFETAIYLREGIDAVCAGHPLADEVAAELEAGPAAAPASGLRRIVLMPGSRVPDVRRHWPLLRDAAEAISKRFPAEVLAVPAPGVSPTLFARAEEAGIRLHEGALAPLLASCDLLLVSSGTSTLQGALCGAPMIVVYRTSPATFALARRLVRVPHIALANLVAGSRIAPELLQADASPERIAAEAGRLLGNPEACQAMREAWRSVWGRLGPRQAAACAARAVLEAIAA
jgi:lipid-A-disaccharide synthase